MDKTQSIDETHNKTVQFMDDLDVNDQQRYQNYISKIKKKFGSKVFTPQNDFNLSNKQLQKTQSQDHFLTPFEPIDDFLTKKSVNNENTNAYSLAMTALQQRLYQYERQNQVIQQQNQIKIDQILLEKSKLEDQVQFQMKNFSKMERFFKEKFHTMDKERQALQQQIMQLSQENQKQLMDNKIEEYLNDLDQANLQVYALQQQQSEKQDEIIQLNSKIQELENKIDNQQENLQRKDEKIDEQHQQLEKLNQHCEQQLQLFQDQYFKIDQLYQQNIKELINEKQFIIQEFLKYQQQNPPREEVPQVQSENPSPKKGGKKATKKGGKTPASKSGARSSKSSNQKSSAKQEKQPVQQQAFQAPVINVSTFEEKLHDMYQNQSILANSRVNSLSPNQNQQNSGKQVQFLSQSQIHGYGSGNSQIQAYGSVNSQHEDLNKHKQDDRYNHQLQMIQQEEKESQELNQQYQNLLNEIQSTDDPIKRQFIRCKMIQINDEIKSLNDKIYFLKKTEHELMLNEK